MVQDSRDFIYYVKIQSGMCRIYEGNPRDPYQHRHKVIFEIMAENCLGFTMDKDNFYFMDENYIVYKLDRYENNRNLKIVS